MKEKKIKISVVDDTEIFLEHAEALLAKNGYTGAEVFDSGSDFLKYYNNKHLHQLSS